MIKKFSAVDYLVAFFIILSINFALPRLMPGDPIQAIYGDEANIAMTPELKAKLTKRFALDQPMHTQFLTYLSRLCIIDLGYSYYYKTPVINVIIGSLPWTLLLVLPALFISSILGFILGVESGYRRGSPIDKMLLSALMLFQGFPDFFAGILLLLLFSVTLCITPLSGAHTPYSGLSGFSLIIDIVHHMTLPCIALIIARLTATYLLTRNSVISTLKDAFILTARAKGCTERTIMYHHAGRNSLLPVVTNTGLQLTHLVTGALFIEIVFAYPGVGGLLYNSLMTRDYPLMQGILLTITIIVLTVNLLVDLLYQRLDPRVSHAH